MKRVLAIAVAMVMLMAACGDDSSDSSTSDVQTASTLDSAEATEVGESLVTDLYDALVHGGDPVLEPLLATGFVSMTPDSISDRSQVLETVDENTFSDYSLSGIEVEQHPGTLTVTYKGALVTSTDDSPESLRVNVFQNIDGEWKAILFVDTGS